MTIFKRIARTFKAFVLAGALAANIGCGGGNNGPVNHAPEFTSTPAATATEEQPYSYDANAQDPDGDTITYSLPQAPLGMTINPSTGLIQWTPTDSQSEMSHDITVKAEDGKGGSDTQPYTINVINTETISGYVSDVLTDNSIENVDVQVGTMTATTDSGGYWQIQNVPNGYYLTNLSNSGKPFCVVIALFLGHNPAAIASAITVNLYFFDIYSPFMSFNL